MKKILAFLLVAILAVSTFGNSTASAIGGFSDVPSNHGFYKDIMYLLEKGVISSSTTFGVNQDVTREEVAVMVSKAVGLNGDKTSTPFKDVPSTLASSGYINSAVKAGIIQGYNDGTFKPKTKVNRGQMAIFIARAFNLTVESPVTFKDMSSNMVSFSSVKKIVASQITTGYTDGTFKPNKTLTRGQISAFIARAMRNENQVNTKDGEGTIKGALTWQYNNFIGTKPDVGAKVFVFPEAFDYKKYSTSELDLFSSIGYIPNNSNLHFAKVNGFGYFEINDVPVGKYTIVISSKNTTRNLDEEIVMRFVLEPLLGSASYKTFELFNLSINKHRYREVEIKKDKTIDASHDFGNTYF